MVEAILTEIMEEKMITLRKDTYPVLGSMLHTKQT